MVRGTSNIDSNNSVRSSEEEEGSVGDCDDDYDYDGRTMESDRPGTMI